MGQKKEEGEVCHSRPMERQISKRKWGQKESSEQIQRSLQVINFEEFKEMFQACYYLVQGPCEILLVSKVCCNLVHHLLLCAGILFADKCSYALKERSSFDFKQAQLQILFLLVNPTIPSALLSLEPISIVQIHGRQSALFYFYKTQTYSLQIFIFNSHLAAFKCDSSASSTTFSTQQGKLRSNFSNTEELKQLSSTLQKCFFLFSTRPLANSHPDATPALSKTATTLSSAEPHTHCEPCRHKWIHQC